MSLLNLDLSKIQDGLPDLATPVRNAFTALQNVVNGNLDDVNVKPAAGMKLSKLDGYPNDGSKFAAGDGTWKAPPGSAGGGTPVTSKAFHSTVQSIPHNAWTTLAFNTDAFDTDAMHDPVTNNSRLTVKTAGKYALLGVVSMANSASVAVQGQLLKNGAPVSGFGTGPIFASSPNSLAAVSAAVVDVLDLVVGDYIELQILQKNQNSSALNTTASGTYFLAATMLTVGAGGAAVGPFVYASGVVADGVADDTAAVLAAINALPVKPVIGGNGQVGTVILPPGEIVCSGLVMPNTQTFSGAGSGASGTAYGNYFALVGFGGSWGGTTLVRKAATDNVMIDASGTIVAGPTITRSCGVRLENLTIDGRGGTKPLVRCYYASNYSFRNLRLENNSGPAIEAVEWQDSRIENVAMFDCAGSVETKIDGTANGQETLRILGVADGNPVSGTFGWTNDNCNNLFFIGCLMTPANNPNAGAIAISVNQTAGTLGGHRIYFTDNKIEAANMKGSMVKLFGANGRVQWIRFLNSDFTGYSLGTGANPITWVEANAAYSCSFIGGLFDDGNTAGITHAPFKLTDSEFWTLAAIETNLGAVGADANPAALIHCGFSNGKPLIIGAVRHVGTRVSPWFSGATITDRRLTPRGGISTQTPGAVATVNIAHGLGYTPQQFDAQPGDANARGAPSRYVTADGTNIVLTFSANLIAATSYTWNWTAS